MNLQEVYFLRNENVVQIDAFLTRVCFMLCALC